MFNLKQQFSIYKQEISQELVIFLEQQRKEFSFLSWSKDVFDRLEQTSLKGKMLRGSLVVLLADYLPKTESEYSRQDLLKTAVAEEIFATALLIHDDIVDNDRLRRGECSLFGQYELLGKQEQVKNPTDFGKSVALLGGDVAIFLAHYLLGQLQISPTIITNLHTTLSKFAIVTGFGEMTDVAESQLQASLTFDKIKEIYTYKTAFYSLCLPFSLAATITNQPAKIQQQLQELGVTLGILFQIKDDELGLFGATEQIGKPAGNDIKEGKQTVFYFELMQRVTVQEKEELAQIFGNEELTASQIDFVRDKVLSSGAKEAVKEYGQQLAKEAEEKIELLEVGNELKNALLQFLEYGEKRDR